METRKKVILCLGIFMLMWMNYAGFVTGDGKSGQLWPWIIMALLVVILTVLAFLPLPERKWPKHPVFIPAGKEGKENKIKEIAGLETSIFNRMETLASLFFPLSVGVVIALAIILTRPVDDQRLVMNHDAAIVAKAFITLLIYALTLVVGYIVYQAGNRMLDKLWEIKKVLITTLGFHRG